MQFCFPSYISILRVSLLATRISLAPGSSISEAMNEQTFGRPDNGDVDKGWAILAVCWAFVACAFISTVLRVWVRVRLTRNMGPDDYNIIVAMVSIAVNWQDQASRSYAALIT